MKSHTGERNYECSICFKKFLYSYNVVAHIRNVHDKKPGIPTCQYCDLTFDKAEKLVEHLRIHLKEEIIEESVRYEYVPIEQDE
jgi:Zinc finger, C2H2 type